MVLYQLAHKVELHSCKIPQRWPRVDSSVRTAFKWEADLQSVLNGYDVIYGAAFGLDFAAVVVDNTPTNSCAVVLDVEDGSTVCKLDLGDHEWDQYPDFDVLNSGRVLVVSVGRVDLETDKCPQFVEGYRILRSEKSQRVESTKLFRFNKYPFKSPLRYLKLNALQETRSHYAMTISVYKSGGENCACHQNMTEVGQYQVRAAKGEAGPVIIDDKFIQRSKCIQGLSIFESEVLGSTGFFVKQEFCGCHSYTKLMSTKRKLSVATAYDSVVFQHRNSEQQKKKKEKNSSLWLLVKEKDKFFAVKHQYTDMALN